MKTRPLQAVIQWLLMAGLSCLLAFAPLSAMAAPYAAMVIDARSGEVLHARNADTRLHPASLTKMMTLYVAFEAIQRGELSLDTKVRISKKAAAEPPSKLGLKAGQRIKMRYLIRAAAVKSANDAATALGEAISGSEAAFARRMNRTAKALGMSRTTFKNAHGLTESGHMSTARDMTTLGRRLFFDHPKFYNLFSRKTTHAGVREVSNTNRRLLGSYRGADGIKTGYTRAAGFNLVASARRGDERIIATVFGGRSGASRNARVAELLDMGFARAPSHVAVRKPEAPNYNGKPKGAGKTIRVNRAVKKSPRPKARPNQAPSAEMLLAMQDGIKSAVEEAASESTAVASAPVPVARPNDLVLASTQPRDIDVDEPVREVVTRMSTSGGRHWGINVGRFTTRRKAESMLLKTALTEMTTLDGALRKVGNHPQGWDANFVGMTQEMSELACRRLDARGIECKTLGPG